MEFGVRVSLLSLPAAMFPSEIVQTWIATLVKSRTQPDEALRLADEGSQDVGSKRVHGKDMGKTVLGWNAPRLLIPDSGVVNYGVKRAELVDLIGESTSLSDACQIGDENRLCAGDISDRFLPSLVIAGMENDSVPFCNEQLSGHSAESVRGACNEDARHSADKKMRPPQEFVQIACLQFGYETFPSSGDVTKPPRAASHAEVQK